MKVATKSQIRVDVSQYPSLGYWTVDWLPDDGEHMMKRIFDGGNYYEVEVPGVGFNVQEVQFPKTEEGFRLAIRQAVFHGVRVVWAAPHPFPTTTQAWIVAKDGTRRDPSAEWWASAK